jgi:hypothetical protein
MVFLKTLLIILLVFFGIRILARYFGPLLLRYVFKKVQKNMEEKFNSTQPQNHQNRHKSSKSFQSKSQSKGKSVGEYVDYEEIE